MRGEQLSANGWKSLLLTVYNHKATHERPALRLRDAFIGDECRDVVDKIHLSKSYQVKLQHYDLPSRNIIAGSSNHSLASNNNILGTTGPITAQPKLLKLTFNNQYFASLSFSLSTFIRLSKLIRACSALR